MSIAIMCVILLKKILWNWILYYRRLCYYYTIFKINYSNYRRTGIILYVYCVRPSHNNLGGVFYDIYQIIRIKIILSWYNGCIYLWILTTQYAPSLMLVYVWFQKMFWLVICWVLTIFTMGSVKGKFSDREDSNKYDDNRRQTDQQCGVLCVKGKFTIAIYIFKARRVKTRWRALGPFASVQWCEEVYITL